MKFKLNYFISLILLHAIAASNKITELQKSQKHNCIKIQILIFIKMCKNDKMFMLDIRVAKQNPIF